MPGSYGYQVNYVVGEFVSPKPPFLRVLFATASLSQSTPFPEEAGNFLQSIRYILLSSDKGKSEVCLEGVPGCKALCSTLKCLCNDVHTITAKKEKRKERTKQAALLKAFILETSFFLQIGKARKSVTFPSLATRDFSVDWSTLSALGQSFCVYHRKPTVVSLILHCWR